MTRDMVIETLKVLPKEFSMEDFIEKLYIRVNALQGIIDVENGNEMSIEEVMKEFKCESNNN